MRDDQAVFEREKWIVGGNRLRVGNVKSGRAYLAIPQRLEQGLLIDYKPARSIDEHGGRLHLRQRLCINEVVGRVVEDGIEGDEVRLRQERINIDVLHGELGLEAFLPDDVGVEHPHVEPDRTPCDLESDTTHAYDAERRAEDILAEVVERMPRSPVARTHGAFALADTTGRRQQQGPCGVGGRVSQHLRGVADGNAASRGIGNIDIVESDGQLAYDLELRSDGVHEVAVNFVGE